MTYDPIDTNEQSSIANGNISVGSVNANKLEGNAGTTTGCRVYMSSDQDVDQNTAPRVKFDRTVYDDGNFDTNSHVYTAPVDGIYFANYFQVLSNGDRVVPYIGDASSASTNKFGMNYKRSQTEMIALTTAKLNQGEKIAFYCGNNGGTDPLQSGQQPSRTHADIALIDRI